MLSDQIEVSKIMQLRIRSVWQRLPLCLLSLYLTLSLSLSQNSSAKFPLISICWQALLFCCQLWPQLQQNPI